MKPDHEYDRSFKSTQVYPLKPYKVKFKNKIAIGFPSFNFEIISMMRQIGTILLLFININTHSQTSKVILEVENINVKKSGDISTGVFVEKNFLKIGKQTYSKIVAVTDNTMEIVFENIPPGDYAFVSFHDIDRNNKLKTNFIGYPKEPVGFSNNAKIVLGPPSFSEAKVKIEAGKIVRVKIKLK